MVYHLKGRRKVKNLAFIVNIVEMDEDMSILSLTDESKRPSKNVGDREFSTRRVSLHGCRWEKWNMDMKPLRTISHESIEKGKLSEKIIHIPKVSDIRNFLPMYLLLIFEKYSWPAIREFFKTDDFCIGYFIFEMREMRMKKSEHIF